MLLYLAVVAGSWFANRLPLRISYRVATVAGMAGYVLARGPRTAIRSNLSVVMGRPEWDPVVRETVQMAFKNNAKNWIDSLRLGATSARDIIDRVDVSGWELLEGARANGSGAIMIGAHLGNIDLVGQIIAVRGFPLTIPVEPVRPEALFRRTQRLRQSLGIQAIPAANSVRQLLRALRAGGVVGIMADRNLEADGIDVEFFGRRTIVAKGPAWLATHVASPVFCGTGVRRADESFDSTITAIDVQRSGDTDADMAANAQLIMTVVEERIRAHPDQWCMFVPMWKA